MIMEYASEPSFSLDGKQILYYDWYYGGFAIMDADGSNDRVVYLDPNAAFPTWSPDGRTILFQSGDFVNWRFNIYAVNVDGSGYRVVVDGEQPAWSPDSSQIIYKGCTGGDCGIMIANADGSGKRRVTMDPNDMNPAWSPDGRKIAFAGNRSGNWEIYVANADGSGIKQLTNHERTDALPAWTSDSRQIVFRSDRDGAWAIWIMNADGTGLRKLTEANASTRWRWEKISVSK
jgi:Tol biopolymer transport system component